MPILHVKTFPLSGFPQVQYFRQGSFGSLELGEHGTKCIRDGYDLIAVLPHSRIIGMVHSARNGPLVVGAVGGRQEGYPWVFATPVFPGGPMLR